ncbi:putative membrane protein [Handroanthus impetiginosus]|uniref:Cytochrome b561 and DOMON domain-containing protein n=1 Tax=Handroanthus impetiginosus TaxID=429701 RepID=A0A2G9G0T3_9LAMI|nr:putative membrane protein [Handroanthus impetiginosus]
MYSSQFLSSVFSFLVLLPLLANAHTCTEDFLTEVGRINISQNCNLKTLQAEFAWNFDNVSRQLEIAFGAKLDTETGWLAWGLNPEAPRMVGTRALIGIKHPNGSLEVNKYSITAFTKLRCPLSPTDNIGLDVRNISFDYLLNIKYYMIRATIVLPKEYNYSSANVVWQIGEAATDRVPFMHPRSLKNFDSAETIDLVSHQVISYHAHPRNRLRMVHGILSIVGWGTLLPVGVIVARYFRKFPQEWSWWFKFHVSCQITGYSLGAIGWGVGLWLGAKSKHYSFHTHRILGIFIFTFTTIQMMALRLKPKRLDEYRIYWNMYHHFLGYAMLVLISVNIFQGIKILEPKPDHVWKWAYIGLLGALGGAVLVLEAYTWLKFWVEKSRKKETIRKEEKPKSEDANNADQPISEGKKNAGGGHTSGGSAVQPRP